jgi:membrane associated rhomboid family serine protease
VIPIPIKDDVPHERFPSVTVGIIVINAFVWLFELVHGVDLAVLDYGAIPAWILHGMRDGPLYLPGVGRVWLHQEVPYPLTVITSMFMHGGWLHIIGNMWFLWIFGDNVEDAMGHTKFAIFYFVCGLVAAGAQILSSAGSAVPIIGASGAIAGVLGAYMLLYARARVRCLWILIIFITFIDLPAWLLLGVWFLSQFFIPGAGVAWMAHVGGFIAGLALVLLFARRQRQRPLRVVAYDSRYGS